jgi:hypothetical protein
MAIKLRKLVVQVDETRIEMGQTIDPPVRRALAIAVIENPYAGRFEPRLDALIDAGEEMCRGARHRAGRSAKLR